ncbi:GntR family transcriptional regulator [Dactylosporangium sp. NPDC051541]|uniref:GntR family transcriptional regulator n=1 Tax=Dactylosporangium sp. NPDC051541 TaxID=3363977 RepID=UPI0037AE43DC
MARYDQIAEVLRERVACGELAVGDEVPSADRLAREFDVGRDTALKAVRLLRNEGVFALGRDCVVRVERRTGTIAEEVPGAVVEVPAVSVVKARMPTPREREELGLADGVPVLVVCLGDVEEVHPAAGTGIRWKRT